MLPWRNKGIGSCWVGVVRGERSRGGGGSLVVDWRSWLMLGDSWSVLEMAL